MTGSTLLTQALSGAHSEVSAADTLATDGARDALLIAHTYRLLGRIGMGATGMVYEAEHVRLGRRFAVKLLRADAELTANVTRRFLREARIVASIHSDHVVGIVDCGQTQDGTPFLVTELLLGQDMRNRLSEAGVLPAAEAIRIARDACLGLAAVHAAGIVHRDLKPANLFLVQDQELRASTCKLLDFGVAKFGSQSTSEQGRVVGTVSYMAPEQILDSSKVGPRADIYSLGAILFESLTGRPPHTGTTAHAVMFKAVHSQAPSIASLRPDLDKRLCEAIQRALSPDVGTRFPTATAFAEALEQCLGCGEGRASSSSAGSGDSSEISSCAPTASRDASACAPMTPLIDGAPIGGTRERLRRRVRDMLCGVAVGAALSILTIAIRPRGPAEPAHVQEVCPAPGIPPQAVESPTASPFPTDRQKAGVASRSVPALNSTEPPGDLQPAATTTAIIASHAAMPAASSGTAVSAGRSQSGKSRPERRGMPALAIDTESPYDVHTKSSP